MIFFLANSFLILTDEREGFSEQVTKTSNKSSILQISINNIFRFAVLLWRATPDPVGGLRPRLLVWGRDRVQTTVRAETEGTQHPQHWVEWTRGKAGADTPNNMKQELSLFSASAQKRTLWRDFAKVSWKSHPCLQCRPQNGQDPPGRPCQPKELQHDVWGGTFRGHHS